MRSSTCVVTNSTVAGRFVITDSKLYGPVLTLSTQDNAELIQQLKHELKRIINRNKYQSHPKKCAENQYLNNLVDPCFQGVNRFFALSFESENGRTSHLELEIKDCNVKIDGKNLFDQQINNYIKIYGKIRKTATGQGDDYTTLLDYSYFKESCEMIVIDLSKQQALDADPRAVQQINFTANLAGNTTMFFIIEEAK